MSDRTRTRWLIAANAVIFAAILILDTGGR